MNKKIKKYKSYQITFNYSYPQCNKICLILSEITYSSNLLLASLIALTNLSLNLLTIPFHLAICLLSSTDLLPN